MLCIAGRLCVAGTHEPSSGYARASGSTEMTSAISLTRTVATLIRIKPSLNGPDTKAMADLAILVIAFHCVASLFVGSRLLILAWRTGKQPEFFAATALLVVAPFGFGLTVASTILIPHSALVTNFLWADSRLYSLGGGDVA